MICAGAYARATPRNMNLAVASLAVTCVCIFVLAWLAYRENRVARAWQAYALTLRGALLARTPVDKQTRVAPEFHAPRLTRL